ncbi:hypothetical protein VD0002_g6867 [Verticillium dahliae]|nr:hypothetical protein VD0004_g5279 [Verticillium dahliae]PNH52989.1 hypothetical protein VD0003_g4379 [Verticillium dahliae]PNH60826.1 hypothetical protein VD0002_g6867 [Verticillium dahliae]PNH72463.1 hypothetical protein VD0001_g5104 [Verticillium dahliae]
MSHRGDAAGSSVALKHAVLDRAPPSQGTVECRDWVTDEDN